MTERGGKGERERDRLGANFKIVRSEYPGTLTVKIKIISIRFIHQTRFGVGVVQAIGSNI